MKHLSLVFLLVALIATAATGCGGEPTPTATPPPPPTSAPTAVPPTTAPVAAVPPASGAQTGPLADAFEKVKTAKAYEVDLNMSGKGSLAVAGGPTPEAGAEDKPISLIVMHGQVNGNDAHFTLQGLLTSFLGIDPASTFEVISLDGKAYLKGPVPLLGANEEKWYEAPAEAASVAQPPLTPGSFLDSLGTSGIALNDFKPAGTETLNNQTCQVYAGDKTAVLDAFSKLGGAAGTTQEDLDAIEDAEFKFWVCEDGFLHQVHLMIAGHDKAKPESKGSFEILMTIANFNGNIVITAPADAIPLKLPQQPTVPETQPTNTPTP